MTERALELQVSQLKENLEQLHELHGIVEGKKKPGTNPQLVAKAIREGFPIPLKYTHSYQGLQALFNYSLTEQDTQLYIWTTEQIKLILSPQILTRFIQEKPHGTKLPVPEETPRRTFLRGLKHPSINTLSQVHARCVKGSFWQQQILRIINVNSRQRTDQLARFGTFLSVSQVLQESFLHEPKRGAPSHPYVIIEALKVKPLVYIPALIEGLGPKEQWDQVIQNEFFQKKVLVSKKCPINPDLMIEKLRVYHAPDYAIAAVPK